eukprot:gene16103-1973_t
MPGDATMESNEWCDSPVTAAAGANASRRDMVEIEQERLAPTAVGAAAPSHLQKEDAAGDDAAAAAERPHTPRAIDNIDVGSLRSQQRQGETPAPSGPRGRGINGGAVTVILRRDPRNESLPWGLGLTGDMRIGTIAHGSDPLRGCVGMTLALLTFSATMTGDVDTTVVPWHGPSSDRCA